MPDLHTWLTEKITAAEHTAQQAANAGTRWSVDLPAAKITTAEGFKVANTKEPWARHIAAHDPAAVLRRCAADRRILARHNTDPAYAHDRLWSVACNGCGTAGDCDDPVTENLNDCPELLDMAAAYGLDDDQLAQLDRPQPPHVEPRYGSIAEAWDAMTRQIDTLTRATIPTSAVPPALRGPNWKA